MSVLEVVNYDYQRAVDTLRQGDQIKVNVVNMGNPNQHFFWDLKANAEGYQIIEKLIQVYNPVG